LVLVIGSGTVGFVFCKDIANSTEANYHSTSSNTTALVQAQQVTTLHMLMKLKRIVQKATTLILKRQLVWQLTINRNTGEITNENNEPVWRYVDKRTWRVYGVGR